VRREERTAIFLFLAAVVPLRAALICCPEQVAEGKKCERKSEEGEEKLRVKTEWGASPYIVISMG
jgi:hypothetical protein